MSLLIKLVIGQFDFIERNNLSHPLLAKRGRIRVNIHAAWHGRVSVSRHNPLGTVIRVPVDDVITELNVVHTYIVSVFRHEKSPVK